jgi:ADP-heptose:LPS heptosyltransferase
LQGISVSTLESNLSLKGDESDCTDLLLCDAMKNCTERILIERIALKDKSSVTDNQLLLAQQNGSALKRCNLQLRRIAVVRALPGLGDFLCAIPALRALRTAFPQAYITLIGLPVARSWAERFEAYIDEFVELPGYPGLPEQEVDAERLEKFLAEMRCGGASQGESQPFDLALQMHGSGVITNSLTLELGAAQSAGFYLMGHSCPDPAFFLPYEESESEIRRYLRLLEFLGIPALDERLEFPLKPCDREALTQIEAKYELGDNYVCIHAGASVPSRCWQGSQFAAVGDAIAQLGYSVVLTGSAAERELASAIAQTMQAPALNLAGQTSLGALAALLSQAKLLICNDTGVSHLGAAVSVPSAVIFSASDPRRWAPLDQTRHRSLSHSSGVRVACVLEQVRDLLHQESIYAA